MSSSKPEQFKWTATKKYSPEIEEMVYQVKRIIIDELHMSPSDYVMNQFKKIWLKYNKFHQDFISRRDVKLDENIVKKL